MNRQREAGFSTIGGGFLVIFGLFGFMLFLACLSTTLLAFLVQKATYQKLPFWIILFVFLSCFVCASAGLFRFSEWFDKKVGEEASKKAFGLVCVIGWLFFIASFIILPIMMFLRKY